jgi:hypothetical protein
MSKKNPPVQLSLVNQAELLFKLEQLSQHIFLLKQLNKDKSFLKDLQQIVDNYVAKIIATHNWVEQFELSYFDAPSANLQPADNPFQDISIELAPISLPLRWLNGSRLGYRCWISHANRRLS